MILKGKLSSLLPPAEGTIAHWWGFIVPLKAVQPGDVTDICSTLTYYLCTIYSTFTVNMKNKKRQKHLKLTVHFTAMLTEANASLTAA